MPVEVDQEAFNEALLNCKQSSWNDRIKLRLCSLQEFAERTAQKYDLIVSNPPFFTNGVKAPLESRAQARHSDSLPLDVLISGAAGMLSEKGRIALVLPVESLQEIGCTG